MLSPDGMIVPGLGDAGDRLYGTPHDLTPEIAAGATAVGSPVAGKRKAGDA